MWLVGDRFIKEMYHTIRALKVGSSAAANPNRNQHQHVSEREIYLHKQYNVKMYYTTSLFSRDNSMTRVVNALIRATNENLTSLPRMILVFLDAEFLNMLGYTGFSISMMIGHCLEWITTQFNRIITSKRDGLKSKRQGSVAHFELKIIWIKMIEDREH